jgi:hypothetical protein
MIKPQSTSRLSRSFFEEAERIAAKERAIQREVDRTDKKSKNGRRNSGAMQAGARVYPVPPSREFLGSAAIRR